MLVNVDEAWNYWVYYHYCFYDDDAAAIVATFINGDAICAIIVAFIATVNVFLFHWSIGAKLDVYKHTYCSWISLVTHQIPSSSSSATMRFRELVYSQLFADDLITENQLVA